MPHIGWCTPVVAGLWILVNPANWHVAIWILVFGACLSHAVCERSQMRGPVFAMTIQRMLLAPPLVWLGRISYSVYLTHMIVAYLTLAVLTAYAPSLAVVAVVLPITLIGTVAISHVMYVTIERPFIEFARTGFFNPRNYHVGSRV